MALEFFTGLACNDCLILMANGDTPPDMDETETNEYLARVRHGMEGCHVVPSCEPDCEESFSWSSCNVCGSNLGGTRHEVTFFPFED